MHGWSPSTRVETIPEEFEIVLQIEAVVFYDSMSDLPVHHDCVCVCDYVRIAEL